MQKETARKQPIAIIGYGCVLPDAPDVATFWQNLLDGKSSIREVPKERWDPDLFWSADRDAEDKTYAKIGAFVEDDAFNGIDYRLPPKVVAQIDPSQRWALAAARQAFLDAGYATGLKADTEGRPFDRTRCAVILGNAMGGELMKLHTKRLYWPQIEQALREDPDFQRLPAENQNAVLDRTRLRYKADVPPVTEDSMPGTLSNVAAGRVANILDLSGKNFTTDAACASSLAALDAAIDTLNDGEADLVVWGGTDRSMDVTPYVEFSKIGALSPDGSRPFDEHANGFVMGEGCVMFLLKRLEDAERDGDRIHAVVRGIGSSSDGKGKGITAPNPVGQVKAVRRAYEDAGIDPTTIGYLEAHGTSTPVGDPVELDSVVEAIRALSDRPLTTGSIAVGSVKSNLGHLKSAAGAVGVLKAVLAMEHGSIPPSINVRRPNPRIDWDHSPYRVQTEAGPWPRPEEVPRRAAVSSFGFGGTNFHVVLEEHIPGRLSPPQVQAWAGTTPPASFTHGRTIDLEAFRMDPALEGEALVLDAARSDVTLAPVTYPQTGEGPRLRDVVHHLTSAGLIAEARVGMHLADPADLPKRLALAQKAAADPAARRLAFAQGVFVGQGPPQGKVAFLFPGQGTQYVNMMRDLAQKYEVVRTTFEEADEVLFDDLGGVRLTDILWPDPDTPEAREAAEEKLKLTEFTQPAVLAADTAMLRLLQQWGIRPDVVAGHSLGEYGALVAAGVLSFADALHAVAARGREMASVDVPDLGKMAAVSADWATVEKAIAGVEGYVIPANKNSPSQTVLAGSSSGVEAAVACLRAEGLQAQFLPVSAAFHSDIVAPASEPLRRVLGRLDVRPPRVQVLSNVGARPYDEDPDAIRDNLAVQVASPVEWIGIIERMHDEGVRTFIEVGPKRALTGFALDILKDRDAVAICANHPKKGGVAHVNELFAFLGAWGFRPRLPALDDPDVYTAAFRDPAAPFRTQVPASADAPETDAKAMTAPAMTTASAGAATTSPAKTAAVTQDPRLDVLTDGLRGLVAQLDEIQGAAGNGGKGAAGDPIAVPDADPVGDGTPDAQLRRRMDAFGFCLDDIGISGISVGLPGQHKPLFDEGDWDRVLAGENLIDALSEQERGRIADKNIVRLVKSSGGEARFEAIRDIDQVIRLAGKRGGFDITDWGVGEELASTLDRTFQYAIAAGLEALRDAGIPLQRTYARTSTGGWLPKEWKLPESLRDHTGIIFASAFPGYDNLVRDISRHLADKYAGQGLDSLQRLYDDMIAQVNDEDQRARLQESFDRAFEEMQDVLPEHGAARYEFNRKFLFNVLSMGHAQLAQFIGARGPNTQVNAACASTTQAIVLAEDWIRTGRCRRVLVVGADDVTSDAMFEWIGAGFLASGAATTKADVAEAALPFDRRRHGMIVGMGAVGMVLEAAPETEARGMRPIARLLATEVANSAFHGSRLDVAHITGCMTRLAAKAQARYGVEAGQIAARTMFMSHETYTPARGGSASAEIHALRATFGDQADRVVIANTKGFTGHPQGAGVEDAIALKCLQRGQVPPIANFRDADPELGDLNLSKGGAHDVRYALRLAAGFGSQVAMTLTELVAREEERIADADAHAHWLEQVTGLQDVATEVVHRTLRVVDQGPPKASAEVPAIEVPAVEASTDENATTTPATTEPAAPSAATTGTPAAPEADTADGAGTGPSDAAGRPDEQAVLDRLIALVAEKTGYPEDLLDPDLDMEADLGIDTVKQAELFGMLREQYQVPLEEGLQIKDYPTLRKVAGYMAERAGGEGAALAPAEAGTSDAAAPDAAAAPQAATDADAVPADEIQADAGSVATDAGAAPETTAQDRAARQTTLADVPGAQADEVLGTLIALVAEKTGYPEDLLDPDLDMEADLGIDTVKQAELFAMLRDQYQVPLEEGLQIKDYPTLRKVAGYMAERAGGTAEVGTDAPDGTAEGAPDPAPEATGAQEDTQGTAAAQTRTAPAASDATAPEAGATADAAQPAASSSGADADEVLQHLLGLVAEKTGYPLDMLEPDLDMEADLGIDTVKQAELFGMLREQYQVPLEEGLQIKDYPTLRRVAGYMAERAGAPEVAGAEASGTVGADTEASDPAPVEPVADEASGEKLAGTTSNGVAEPGTGTAEESILRRVPVLRQEARPGTGPALERGAVLVVGDADETVLQAFKKAGFDPRFNLEEGEAPVGLLAIGTRVAPEKARQRIGDLFDAAKRHAARFSEGRFVCVVTAQDGAHGLQEVRDPGMAGLAGLGKALRKEFPEALVKTVDLHPDAAATEVVEELLHGGTRTEVAYAADGTRCVVDVVPAPLEGGTPDVAGKHLVVSGGAQGITVELLAALAPQGPRLLLLGRTEVPEEAAAWARLDEAGWKQAEQDAIARIREAGERPTPVALQKALAPLRKAAEVHRNVERLRALGADVLYRAIDVTDPDAVAAVVRRSRKRFGRVHGVVHAAGVEISKDIASKDRAQFDLVTGVKMDGWEALMAATQGDPVRILVGFSSVAGRFGNLGQVDYSAANEWLAKAVRAEARTRGADTAFTISWGPWGEVGMATRGSILQIMEASGVTPIPTQEGVRHFLDELATPGARESVVAGRLGAIDVDGQVVDTDASQALSEEGTGPGAGQPTEEETAASDEGSSPKEPDHREPVVARIGSAPQAFRLLHDITSAGAEHLTAQVLVDAGRDPYLADHSIDGVPVFPGVFGLEAFAEAAALLVPGGLLGFEDVAFASPLKQLKDAPVTADLEARVVSAEEEPEARVHCRLTTRFVAPDGKVYGEPRLHFEATVRLGDPVEAPRTQAPACDGSWERPDIYPPFFHGPSFQVLDSAGPLEGDAVARLRVPTEAHFGDGGAEFLAQPMVLEALFQVCGLRTLAAEQAMSLPLAIDRVELFGGADDVVLVARSTEPKDSHRRFDAEAVAPDGRVVARLHGYAMIETGPAPVVSLREAATQAEVPPLQAWTGGSGPSPGSTAGAPENGSVRQRPSDAADLRAREAAEGPLEGWADERAAVEAREPTDDVPAGSAHADLPADGSTDGDEHRATGSTPTAPEGTTDQTPGRRSSSTSDAHDTPRTDRDAPAADRRSPTTDRNTPTTEGDAPATDRDAPTREPDAPTTGRDAPPTDPAADEAAEAEPRKPAPDIPEADVPLPAIDAVAFAAVAVEEKDAQDPWFTAEERAKHASFPVPKRAAEWRAGRLAAKAAVRKASPGLDPRDVVVESAESGQPFLVVQGRRLDVALTITHRDGLALAAVSEEPIGIDLETVEPCDGAFLEQAFGPDEIEVISRSQGPELEATCRWAAKEAVLKRVGTGLRADLRAYTVEADGEGGADVDGPPGTFGVRFYDVQGRVLAVSHPSCDPLKQQEEQ